MLARQLVTGFLAVILPSTILLGGVTAYSLASLDRVNRDLVEIMRSREAVADLQLTLTQTGAPLGAYLLGGNPSNRQRFEQLIRASEDKLQSCAAAPCHVSTRLPDRMIDAVRPTIERLKENGRLVFETGPESGTIRVEMVRESIAGVRRAVEPMLAAVHRRNDELIGEAAAVRRRAWTLTASLMILIALAGSLAASVVARRISQPVSNLVSGTRRVMAGDWTYQAPSGGTGEVGELAASFNKMVHELRRHRESLEDHNRTLEERVRQRTEELKAKEQALVQSEKLSSIGLLAAGIAHELNNPLTSIVLNANLLIEEAGESSPLSRELKKIDADASRCRRIIDDLRAFARLPQIEKVASEVEMVVERAVSVAAHDFTRRGVEIQRELAPDLPKVIWDADRMVQVLTNLLVNAAQASVEGGRVVLRGRYEQDWLTLEVQDSGTGIPAEDRIRIFDPFFTTKPDGTGLGLSISYGIVKEHGGRIEVESHSREGVGAGGETGTIMRVVVPVGETRA